MIDIPGVPVAGGEKGHDDATTISTVRICIVGDPTLTNVYWSVTPNRTELANREIMPSVGGILFVLLDSSVMERGMPIPNLKIHSIDFSDESVISRKGRIQLGRDQSMETLYGAQDGWYVITEPEVSELVTFTVTLKAGKYDFQIDPEVDIGPPGVHEA